VETRVGRCEGLHSRTVVAAIVPAELAAELENLTPGQFHELLEDFADAQAAREALAEIEAGASPVPAEQVWTELGLDS
jgi:hypothetical protein